ncbi:MAG TPA: V-type ATP synthase subunit B, partial [Dehalococcoidia bacterium]|nr:V-type ATP synthase subunit B [Dehalococcoidia bacterium]
MNISSLYIREGRAINKAKGSLIVAESIPGIKFNEIVDVQLSSGEIKTGQAIDISEEATIVQVFGGVSELDLIGGKVRCKGETLKLPVSIDILGRIFNGMGEPIDGAPPIIPEDYLDINGQPINPASRQPPAEFIETGISAIDGL